MVINALYVKCTGWLVGSILFSILVQIIDLYHRRYIRTVQVLSVFSKEERRKHLKRMIARDRLEGKV